MVPNNFTIFTILGATGDLVDKKIIPALYHLFQQGEISVDSIKILAFARRDFTGGKYRQVIDHSLETYAKIDPKIVNLEPFYSIFEYHQGQFDNRNDFVNLAEKIDQIQNDRQICANKIFYLAIPTDLYGEVVSHIVYTQLQDMCSRSSEGLSQLIIEKPFGADYASSRNLDLQLKQLFDEEQIYRIDHYLGKNIIRDLMDFRHAHLQDRWNSNFIKTVSISTVEELGVENRGAFYDSVGALVDVGQNHLLELLAVLTMPLSKESNFDYQLRRAEMIGKLKKYSSAKEFQANTFRAQYDGYKSISGVKPSSNMETYFKVSAWLSDDLWEGVPFYLESGKRCGVSKKEILIEFNNGDCLKIDFSEGTTITLNKSILSSVQQTAPSLKYVGDYANLFRDALAKKRHNFISIEEVEAAWEFIDPIRLAWNQNLVHLETYHPDSSAILSKTNLKTRVL